MRGDLPGRCRIGFWRREFVRRRLHWQESAHKGPSELCPKEEEVSVKIQGESLTFTNSKLQNFVLSFNPDAEGSFNNIYMDAGGRAVSIRGRITGGIIEADVDNEPCRHHWQLKKEH
jgi:hypothetical protein